MLLNYKVLGEGDPIVLLHGLFGSLENLGVIARQLQDKFQIISIDLPDHGQSPRSKQFKYQDYAAAVVNTLHHLGMSQGGFLGHSMGGKVAMNIALSSPEIVTKLLVADIAPVAYEPRHDNVFCGLNAVDLSKIATRSDADKQMAEHINEAGVRQFLLKSLEKTAQGFGWKFNLALLQRDYHALSQGIESNTRFEGPTLFVKGGNSNYITAEHQAKILRLFPNATAKIINDTGHWLHAEKPFVFAGIAERFFTSER